MPTEVLNQLRALREGIAETLRKDPRYLTLSALDKSIAEITSVLSASGLVTAEPAAASTLHFAPPAAAPAPGPEAAAPAAPIAASLAPVAAAPAPVAKAEPAPGAPLVKKKKKSLLKPMAEVAAVAAAAGIVAEVAHAKMGKSAPKAPGADAATKSEADDGESEGEPGEPGHAAAEHEAPGHEAAESEEKEPGETEADDSDAASAETKGDDADGEAKDEHAEAKDEHAEGEDAEGIVPKGKAAGYVPMAAKPGAAQYQPSIAVKFGKLPNKVDLRPLMTPIEDQGDTSSCVANAVAGAYEYWIKKASKQDQAISRLFVYYNARWRDGSQDKDDGSVIQLAMEGLQKFGACHENVWPFDPKLVLKKPGAEAYKDGVAYRVQDMQQVPLKIEAWKQALAEGKPIVFGCALFDSFDECSKKGGVVPMPSPDDVARAKHSGHSMCAVGYSDTEKVFIVRNSWGTEWGDKGYCYMPYDYLLNPKFNDNDCWVFVPKIPSQPPREVWSDTTDPVTNGGQGVDFAITEYTIADYEHIAIDLWSEVRRPFNETILADYSEYVSNVARGAWSELESFDFRTFLATTAALTGVAAIATEAFASETSTTESSSEALSLEESEEHSEETDEDSDDDDSDDDDSDDDDSDEDNSDEDEGDDDSEDDDAEDGDDDDSEDDDAEDGDDDTEGDDDAEDGDDDSEGDDDGEDGDDDSEGDDDDAEDGDDDSEDDGDDDSDDEDGDGDDDDGGDDDGGDDDGGDDD